MKIDSSIWAFLKILQKFLEHLFCRTSTDCFFLSSTSDYCILINPFHALVSFDTPENIRKPFHGASKESSGMKWVKFTRVCFIFRNHTQNRLVLHHSFSNMKTREACNVHKMLFSYIHACTQNANCIPWVPGKNG